MYCMLLPSTMNHETLTRSRSTIASFSLPSLRTESTIDASFGTSQAKQLKDYENAVIAKRLEELDDDEVQALVEEVEKDSF